jgi:hypothetical protein
MVIKYWMLTIQKVGPIAGYLSVKTFKRVGASIPKD